MGCLLCVPLMVDEVDAALADAGAARVAGADMVEYRVDRLFSGEGDEFGRRSIGRLVAESPLPCIVTCRSAEEGGEYDGDDAARVSLYEWLGSGGAAEIGVADGSGAGGSAGGPSRRSDSTPRYLDFEHSSLVRSANLRQKVRLSVSHPNQPRELGTGLILSAHDFVGRPADLFGRLASMRAEDSASVIKVAFRARSLRDNLELFDILRERDRPTIALGIGEFGLMSRVLAPKFGGFLTFASLREQAGTAPGQPTIAELLGMYRFRSIGRATRVFGVIGWPVAHSLSPRLHNALFTGLGFDGVYLPMPVPTEWEHFKATVLAMLDAPGLGLAGASVTVPHKEHLLRLAREDRTRPWSIDPLAARAGAANTLVVDPDGRCRVLNTDIAGVLHPLRGALVHAGAVAAAGDRLDGVAVGVLGAGGAARAAAAGLLDAGARVIIANRTGERARSLAEDLRRAFPEGPAIETIAWERRAEVAVHAWINGTTLGLAGTPDASTSAMSEAELREAARRSSSLGAASVVPGLRLPVVFDTVYAPPRTPLLRLAESLGLACVTGQAMFVRQAAEQSRAWTGREPSLTEIKRILDEPV